MAYDYNSHSHRINPEIESIGIPWTTCHNTEHLKPINCKFQRIYIKHIFAYFIGGVQWRQVVCVFLIHDEGWDCIITENVRKGSVEHGCSNTFWIKPEAHSRICRSRNFIQISDITGNLIAERQMKGY